MYLYNILLAIHITCGGIALGAGLSAMLTKQVISRHQWHMTVGRFFYYAMVGIFVTALPMTILKPDLFLFLVSIFSFYLAHAGWRYAKNRKGIPRRLDYFSAGLMIIVTLAMIAYGIYLLRALDDNNGITMLVFGSIGLGHGLADMAIQLKGGVKGKHRIAMHLTLMMGASIATVTAFIVTNIEYQPRYVLWIAPGLSLVPLVLLFNYRLYKHNVT